MSASTSARSMGGMEAPSHHNEDLPALAAIGIIAMMVLLSIAIYLLLGNQQG